MEEKRHDCCSKEKIMNIIVTTPKSELKHIKNEVDDVENTNGVFFRAFKIKPNVQIDEHIYFVQNGVIRGFGIVCEIKDQDSEVCETTGRTWKGNRFVYYNNWHWLKRPIKMNGFQGFRYAKKYGITGDEECRQ